MTRAALYDRVAARTAAWACALLDEDGFRGCAPAVLAYYKAPVGLLHTGHAGAAARALNVAERLFFRDGDFHAHPDDPTPRSGRSYRNGWLAWGAQLLGAYHLSEPTLDRLAAGLHPHSGGAPDDDAVEASRRIYPAGGTASVANALLAGGRTDAALRAGRFLKDLFDAQPADASCILLARDAQGQPIDPREQGLTAGAENFVFDLDQPAQICWIFGFSLRVFARLYRATEDRGWLSSADRLGGWMRRAHASLHSNITNGKIAWGAAEMYGATGRQEWLALATGIGDWVASQQGDDGVWVRRPQYASSQAQPLPVSLDTSIERMFYMLDMQRALALAPQRDTPPA